jgi:hypothetical protein
MRRLLKGALLAGGLIWLGYTFRGDVDQILSRTAGYDFHNYYYSTKAFRFHGASIYDHAAMHALSQQEQGTPWVPPYVYPPYLTVLFLPLVTLRFETVRVLWLVLCYGFLFGSFDALSRLCALAGKRPVDWRLRWFAPIVTASLFEPFRDHTWYGQSNLLVLFLMCWGIYLEWKQPARFPIGGALLLATAGVLKLFPMFLFPCYLAMRRYRTVFAIGTGVLVLTGFTLLFVPFSEFLRFPEVLSASMYVAGSPYQFRQDHSASSVLRHLIAPTAAPAVAILLLRFVPYGGYLVMFAREGAKGSELVRLLRLSQVVVLLVFVMFRWWEHHLVMLLLPYFVAAYGCSVVLPGRGRPLRIVTTTCLAASAAYIAAVSHPLLHSLSGRPLVFPMPGKFAAQLLLLGVLEVLIRTAKPKTEFPVAPSTRNE